MKFVKLTMYSHIAEKANKEFFLNPATIEQILVKQDYHQQKTYTQILSTKTDNTWFNVTQTPEEIFDLIARAQTL